MHHRRDRLQGSAGRGGSSRSAGCATARLNEPSPPRLPGRWPAEPAGGEVRAAHSAANRAGLEIQTRHPMHPKAEGDLAAVMNVVLDKVPDDPLARTLGPLSGLVWPGPDKLLSEISRRPPRQPRLDHCEALLEPPDDLGGRPRGQRLILIPIGHRAKLRRPLPHPGVHPPSACGNDMARQRPHGHEGRRSDNIQLSLIKRRDHLHQPALMSLIAASNFIGKPALYRHLSIVGQPCSPRGRLPARGRQGRRGLRLAELGGQPPLPPGSGEGRRHEADRRVPPRGRRLRSDRWLRVPRSSDPGPVRLLHLRRLLHGPAVDARQVARNVEAIGTARHAVPDLIVRRGRRRRAVRDRQQRLGAPIRPSLGPRLVVTPEMQVATPG